MSEKDYAADLAINKNALDREWLNQGNLFFRYARDAARADVDAKRAKEKMELVYAEMYGKCKDAQDKPTEASIKAAILQSDEYKAASAEYNDATEEAKILGIAVDAMAHRKSALENLVKLYLAGYYSSPSDEKGEATEAAVEKGTARHKDKLSKYKKGAANE